MSVFDFGMFRDETYLADPHGRLLEMVRDEIQVLYDELLSRIVPFRLDPARPMTYLCSQIIGIDKLYLVWNQ